MGVQHYVANLVHCDKTVEVIMQPGFTTESWEGLNLYARDQFTKGWLFWDIDMRRLAFMNSQMLGLLVAFNSAVSKLGGNMRVIVAQNSMIDQLLTVSQLRKVMTVLAMQQTRETQRT